MSLLASGSHASVSQFSGRQCQGWWAGYLIISISEGTELMLWFSLRVGLVGVGVSVFRGLINVSLMWDAWSSLVIKSSVALISVIKWWSDRSRSQHSIRHDEFSWCVRRCEIQRPDCAIVIERLSSWMRPWEWIEAWAWRHQGRWWTLFVWHKI